MLTDQALTTVKTALGQPGLRLVPVAFLESLIEEASAEFQKLCGRDLYFRTGIEERVPGYGTQDLQVEEANPVVEVTLVQNVFGVGTAEIPSDSYYVKTSRNGRSCIRLNSGCWQWTADFIAGVKASPVAGTERDDYQVDYSGGYVTPNQAEVDPLLTRNLPFDIERAVLDLVASLFLQRGKDKTVTSKTTSAGSQTWTNYPPNFEATAAAWSFL